MGHPRDRQDGKRGWRSQWPLLMAFVVVPAAIELTLTAADWGLLPVPRLRAYVYANGAFWAGLLDNWRPNYPAQPWLMFVTYSFLHASLWHVFGNILSLLLLMRLTEDDLRGWRFLFVYVVSAIGGALGFALLGTALNPMVGSSGAIFGLLGVWRWREWSKIAEPKPFALTLLRDVLALALVNAVMWWVQDRALAWEAHLGGFVAGVFAIAVLDWWQDGPRRRTPPRET